MVKVEIIQGFNEIGGNCIRIEDNDTTIMFDQGIRFSLFRRYYSRIFSPRGIPELRDLRIIPPLESYNGISVLYITHFHLDHLGLLQAVPDRISIKIPSRESMELIEKWYEKSTSWLAYVPPKYTARIEEVSILKSDKNNVMAIPVRHSSYPALAYIYFGSNETVLYTGDFRIDPILSKEQDEIMYTTTLLDYLNDNPDIKIDTLIIEGTNFGRVNTPISGEVAQRILNKIVNPNATALEIIGYHDIEIALMNILILKNLGKQIIITSNRLLEQLELWNYKLGLDLNLGDLFTLPTTIETATIFSIIDEMDVIKEPQKYAIITDLHNLEDTLSIFRNQKPPGGSLALLLLSEPIDESSVQEEKTVINWLQYYGFLPYRLRISGHYYPHQLKKIIEVIKPRRIKPIHTTRAPLLHKVYEDTRPG